MAGLSNKQSHLEKSGTRLEKQNTAKKEFHQLVKSREQIEKFVTDKTKRSDFKHNIHKPYAKSFTTAAGNKKYTSEQNDISADQPLEQNRLTQQFPLTQEQELQTANDMQSAPQILEQIQEQAPLIYDNTPVFNSISSDFVKPKEKSISHFKDKQNHLEKSTTRFEKKVDKLRVHNKREFQINFVRTQNSKGRFVTKANIVRCESSGEERQKGLLHSLDYSLRNRINGDVPSLAKKINSFKPKTVKGKVFKAAAKTTNFAVHDVGRTAMDVGLAAETLTTATTEAVSKTAVTKGSALLSDMYTQQAKDDMNRAVIFSGKLVFDSAIGLKNHFVQRKEANQLKKEFKLKKAELKNFKKTTYKPRLKETSLKLSLKKSKFKTVKKSYKQAQRQFLSEKRALNLADKSSVGIENKLNIRTALYKARKAKFKTEKKSLVIATADLKAQKKSFKLDKKNAQKEFKLAQPSPAYAKIAEYGAKRLKASAHQKLLSADERNDTLKAVDKSNEIVKMGANKLYNSYSVKNRLMKKNQQIRKLEKKSYKLQRKSNRIDNKINHIKSQKAKNKYLRKSNKLSQKDLQAKKKQNRLKKSKASLVAFSTLSSTVLILCIVMLFLITALNGTLEAIFGNSGWVMGTYTSQDKYLSQAEEYYTKLAFEMNEKVLKVGTEDDWEDGLEEFDIDTSDMDDDPDVWIWGNSTKFNYDPVYDFDTFKLWSYLCAYYFDFNDEDDEAAYWKYDGDTEEIIKELFNAEYKFEYYYDNTSRWEELSTYTIFGGGSGSYGESASYYTISGDDDYSPKRTTGNSNWTYKIHPIQLPSELNDYLDSDGWLYFKKYNGEYRIVNCNETSGITGNWKLTPYIIPDTRYYVDSAHTVKPFYYKLDDNKFAFKPSDVEYERDYRYWTNDDHTKDEAWFAVTPNNAKQWNSSIDNNKWLVYYAKKYEWVTDCRLYYNVKQKKTFDKVIESKLKAMDHGSERYKMYKMFLGTAEDSETVRGNHQEFFNPLSGSIQDYIDSGSILNGYGYDMQAWNTKHCGLADDGDSHLGIDITCGYNSRIYAGMDGIIDKIDRDNDCIVIRKNNYNYWYDGDGSGKKRDTKIYYYNVSAKNSLNEGDSIKKGDYLGLSMPEHKCEDISNDSVGNYYLHLKIEIDTDGYGWDFIDPRLVLE